MAELTIDAAMPDQAELLAALIREAFAEYAGRLDPPSSAHGKTAERVRAELADGGALIARIGEHAVGCVFWHPYSDHVYLDRLAVLPDMRGRGIGRALIAAVERQTLALGLCHVRLSVRLALEQNRVLYEQLGYRVLSYGIHAGYSAPTFVMLEKRLSPTTDN